MNRSFALWRCLPAAGLLAALLAGGCGPASPPDTGGRDPLDPKVQYGLYRVAFPPGLTPREQAWLLETLDETEKALRGIGLVPEPTAVIWVWNQQQADEIGRGHGFQEAISAGRPICWFEPTHKRTVIVYEFPGVSAPWGSLAVGLASCWMPARAWWQTTRWESLGATVEQVLATQR